MTALDRIIKSQASISKKLTVPCVEAEELPAALPQSLTEEFRNIETPHHPLSRTLVWFMLLDTSPS